MRDRPILSPAFAGSGLACLRGGRLVFADLAFALSAGGALRLVGPNGTGKSTLLRLMAGLLRPFAGALLWQGQPVAAAPDAHRLAAAYQGHADTVKPTLTMLEALAFWAALAPDAEPGRAAAVTRARAALAADGLEALAGVPGRYLSSGQRRRLALARLAVDPRPLWLLDEPTVGLDVAAVARLEERLAAHRAGGGMVVLATHTPIDLPGAETLDLADFAVAPGEADGLGDGLGDGLEHEGSGALAEGKA